MQNNPLYSTLLDLGLGEKEAQVYLSSLTLGPATVLQVSRMSGIQRTNIYPILEKLEQRGLIKQVIEGLKTKYAAEDPGRLEVLVEQRRKALLESMPTFKALFNLEGNESVIKHYHGLEGVKGVYEDLLRPLKMNDFYYAIANVEKWQSLGGFYLEHIEKRTRLGSTVKLLFEDSPAARERQKRAQAYHENIRIIPELFSVDTDLVITPYSFAMFQLSEPLEAIVVNNKSLTQMHKRLFEILWEKSPQ